MQSFLLPLIVILMANATTVLLFKKKFSKVLIFTLLLLSFPMFISGIFFSTFKIGFIVNILYSLSSVAILLIKRKDKNIINNFKENYISSGLVAFLTIYVFVFIYDFNRYFTMWDEKSHWGVMLKEMIRLDKFYSVSDSTLMVHKDYPPILQLYELFFIKLCGGYKEAYAIRGLHLLELSFIIPFIKDIKMNLKNIFLTIIKTSLSILMVLLTILLFDSHGIINNIYNDYLLSFIVVYLLLYIFYNKELLNNDSLFILSLSCSFLLLTKQVAIAFYFMIIFFYIIKIIKENKSLKDYIKIIVMLIIIPLLMYKIWGIYISNFEMEKQFIISDIKVSELKNIIIDSANQKHVIVTDYMNALINKKISFFKFFDISYLYGFIIFTILFILFFRKKDKKESFKLFLTIFFGTVGYALLMLLLYLFCFKEEGYTLASFDRYMDIFLIIEFLLIVLFVIKNTKENQEIKIYIFMCLILLISIDRIVYHRLKPAVFKHTLTPEEVVANNIINKTKEKDKIFLLSQYTNATYQFSVKYYANPRITNLKYFELPLENTDYYDYFYSQINDYMLDFDYVYIVSTTDELNNKYNFIFKNIKNNELYKIENNNGKVKLDLVK